MRIQRRLATMAFIVLASVLAARAADLSGTWKAEFDTQIGKQNYTFTLKQDGEKITGKAIGGVEGQQQETELKEGKLQGNIIAFVENLDFQGNTLRIEYKGTVTGDEIKFSRKVGEFADEELVAKREKVVAAAAPAPKK